MRTAIVRIDPDPQRVLPPGAVGGAVPDLERRGFAVHRRPSDRELELVVDSLDAADARHRAGRVCAEVFGTDPEIGPVTFLSRGTDEDAHGVVAAFGVRARLERVDEHGEEVAVFTIAAADRRRVPESRLHTALEAALNCEVRIEFG